MVILKGKNFKMCGRDEEKNETEVLLVRQSSSEGCGIPGA